MVKCCVLFEVRTEFLHTIYTSIGFKCLGLKLATKQTVWKMLNGSNSEIFSKYSTVNIILSHKYNFTRDIL
jgi:hypothetical protein